MQRLYDYEFGLSHASSPVQQSELMAEKQAFLDGGFKAELLEDESAQQLLFDAYEYSVCQQLKCDSDDMSHGKYAIPQFIVKDMATRYGAVSDQIYGMLPQEQVQE